MWLSTKEKLDGSIMFFQFIQKNNLCIFNFTNMKNFYTKEIHKSSFKSIYASNNQLVEVEAENLIEYLNSIEETSNINYKFYPRELNIRTDMIITLTEGYPPFKLNFELESKNFYLNITSPLLKLIVLLKKSQEELINIIEKKDLEINEYILEGCNITHENMKTEKFDKINFLINTFENKDLCDESLNLYEIYTSSLIEQFNNRDTNEYQTLNDLPLKMESEDLLKIPLKKKYLPSTSTTMEVTDKSVNVKKKKSSSLLKNL